MNELFLIHLGLVFSTSIKAWGDKKTWGIHHSGQIYISISLAPGDQGLKQNVYV